MKPRFRKTVYGLCVPARIEALIQQGYIIEDTPNLDDMWLTIEVLESLKWSSYDTMKVLRVIASQHNWKHLLAIKKKLGWMSPVNHNKRVSSIQSWVVAI